MNNNDLARALGIDATEQAILDSGSAHPFTCRCHLCLRWWVLMGPQDVAGKEYGPFTEEEVLAEKSKKENKP